MYEFVIALLIRFALRHDSLLVDKLMVKLGGVCRSWRQATRDPLAWAGVSRMVSYDVGTKNLSVWLGAYIQDEDLKVELPIKYYDWELIDLGTNKPVEAIPKMVEYFINARPFLLHHVHYARIENQPRAMATQMQSIASSLQTVYSYVEKSTPGVPGRGALAPFVRLVNAGEKLKVLEGTTEIVDPAETVPKPESKSGQYTWRKKVSILQNKAINKYLVEKGLISQRWPDSMEEFEKKDDLADSADQGIRELRVIHGLKKQRRNAVAKRKTIKK